MQFKIGFDSRDIDVLHSYWDKIIASQRWSEGKCVTQFEDKWRAYNGTSHAIATSSWAGAALAVMEYLDLQDKVVLCPSNTFMATPLSIVEAGGRVEFVDCNRDDLCMSYEDLKHKG